MAISINKVRNLVLYLLSKNNYGYISPEQFNSFCELAVAEIFETLFYLDNNSSNKKYARLTNTQYADLKKIREEQIDMYSTYSTPLNFVFNSTTGLWNYTQPDLYRAVNLTLINSTTGKRVDIQEVSKGAELNKILNSNMVSPTTTYPYAVRVGNDFKVYPTNIAGFFVELLYIRKPKTPKWTYVNSNGNPVYNASATDLQDIDLHISLFSKVVSEILSYCGISLREQQVTQFAEQEEAGLQQEQS